ncbi:RecB family exonuclease [Prosthecobacter vanneervenii]|uniref:Putative RecB family exonuclease n=1 Tax=Prosthecobacter vanneervenii TaxID=48466 RepID=A0A7W8DL93_9BACT|nr:PD-(D/E)XK nuclease family protein [Prosthecobacter vanneervenii]MBB5033800.1 putative RecB family exonuclease [Prosthecobacter vanneervenii]
MNTTAASPPERSEQDVITALQETVSASRLSLFLQCRLKFYFRYVLKLKKPKTASLHLGNAVHAVLKAWNKARWVQQPLSLKVVHETYLAAWADDTEGSVDWEPGEEEADKTTGWRLLDTYLRESHMPAAIKPDAVEVPVEADLQQHGLPRLIGILDLVQHRQIIDYKTSATTPNADKVAHTTEIQTCSYAILYRHNTGAQETGMQLHHLVKLKNPKVVITTLPPMSPGQETRLFRQMEAYLEGLQRRDFIPSPGMHCSSCEFYNECRRWH